MDQRVYINSTEQARAAVEEIIRMVTDGVVLPRIAFDVETAPLPGLEGYPGTEFELTEDGEERRVRATKQAYLKFAQRIWKGSFTPTGLRILRLYIPEKTTSGKVGELTAQEAWQRFLDRLEELMASEGGRSAIEMYRWQEEGLNATLERLAENIEAARKELEAAQNELHNIQVMGGKGQKKWESAAKKASAKLSELQEGYNFLNTYARERITKPLDLRLLAHVVRVGVEGRTYLTTNGDNRLDPVKPGLDPYTSTIFLVQFTLKYKDGGLASFIFNTNEGKVPLEVLRPVLELNGVRFEGQNLKFDLKMLMHHAGYAPKNVHCTMIADRMMYLGVRGMKRGLGALTKRYLNRDIDKAMQTSFVGRRYEEPTPEQLEYAFVDTEVIPDLVDAQVARSEKFGQRKLIDTFSKLSWITAKWELEGYRINVEKWLEIAAEAARHRDEVAHELEMMLLPEGYAETFASLTDSNEELEELENAMLAASASDDDEGGPAVDVRKNAVVRISQTKLVLELLEKLLGMGPLANLTGSGKASLEKTARGNLEREYRNRNNGQGHPFFQKYALWSKLAKQASTYGKKFLWAMHPLTGKIHPTFHIAGTDTGRYSSTGPNWLNIPAAKEPGDPDFRGAIESAEGCYWLGADYETMELRIAGDVFKDVMVKKMAESGADAHGFTACLMFHVRQGSTNEPVLVKDVYRRGSQEFDIDVWELPKDWTPEQVAEFALSENGVKVVKAVKERYGKDITRGDAKSVTFLWLFQGTPYTLAIRTGLAQDHCELLFERFAGVYQAMDSGLKKMADDAVEHNVIEGANGRRYAYTVGYCGIRRYAELPAEPWEADFPTYSAYYAAYREWKRQVRRVKRQLTNLPTQGGNAVISSEALLYAVERGEALGVYPKLLIYDEMIVEAPDRVKPAIVKGILESSMLNAADTYMAFVPAGAEADVTKAGKVWKKS